MTNVHAEWLCKTGNMNWLSVSLRNLFRQSTRTGISVGAIAFGVIAMLLAGGFMEWIFWAMRESTIQSRLGHIQVVRAGYQEHGLADPYAYLLPSQSPVLKRLEAVESVQVVAPRLTFSGLISFADHTISFVGEGVVSEREKVLSEHVRLTSGDRLGKQQGGEVFMGEGLASNLGVSVGDSVVLMVTPYGGGINAVEATVVGLFATSSKAYDDTALRVPLELAERLIRKEGAHRWVVLLKDTQLTDGAISEMAKLLQGRGDYELLPWHQLANFYTKTVRLFSRQMMVLWTLIGFIIVLTISNTLIRGMLERTGEIGTLMALGTKRREVLRMFVTEGVMLGLLGAAIGLALGVALAHLISWVGIPMPPPPGMNRGFTGEIRLTSSLVLQALVMAVVTASLASLYPAWRASRLQIVDALRHYR
jgi:putative ABC transport system permease protein